MFCYSSFSNLQFLFPPHMSSSGKWYNIWESDIFRAKTCHTWWLIKFPASRFVNQIKRQAHREIYNRVNPQSNNPSDERHKCRISLEKDNWMNSKSVKYNVLILDLVDSVILIPIQSNFPNIRIILSYTHFTWVFKKCWKKKKNDDKI